jgi:ABC-type Mn2+/Zn2+ transport system permease subunit
MYDALIQMARQNPMPYTIVVMTGMAIGYFGAGRNALLVLLCAVAAVIAYVFVWRARTIEMREGAAVALITTSLLTVSIAVVSMFA